MAPQEYEPTKISVETEERKMCIELPWDADATELVHAFYTLVIGMTFLPTTILHAMQNYAAENLDDEEYDREKEL